MEVSREEMLEFGKMATYHLDDRLVPFDRETLRAEAWLLGYEFARRYEHPANKQDDEQPAVLQENHETLGQKRLGDNELSLNWYTAKRCQIIFNQKISELAISCECKNCIMMRDNNALYIALTCYQGIKLSLSGERRNLLSICNGDLWQPIVDFFHLKDYGNYRIKMNISKQTTDEITIQLIKCYPLDELRGINKIK